MQQQQQQQQQQLCNSSMQHHQTTQLRVQDELRWRCPDEHATVSTQHRLLQDVNGSHAVNEIFKPLIPPPMPCESAHATFRGAIKASQSSPHLDLHRSDASNFTSHLCAKFQDGDVDAENFTQERQASVPTSCSPRTLSPLALRSRRARRHWLQSCRSLSSSTCQTSTLHMLATASPAQMRQRPDGVPGDRQGLLP